MPKLDAQIDNHGTILLVTPISPAAKEWVEENLQLESWQWLGGGFAVEPRYVGGLVEGMRDDGLLVA